MAETLTDQFTYVDGGRLILKKSWFDPETGETYDTFDEVGDAPADVAGQTGMVTDPGTLNQTTGQPSWDAGAAYGPTPPSQPGASTTGQRTAQSSSTYASPAPSEPRSQPAAPSPGAGTQTYGTGSAANAPSSAEAARQLTLYDYTNPQFALQNAMLKQGYNPFVASPFMSWINRTAPGLGQAFLLNQAGRNLTPADSARGPDRFQQFLQGALSGGNIPGLLQGAAGGGLQNAVGAIRDYQDRLAGGEAMPNANPYLVELMNTLQAGNGQGTANFLGATLGPFMGRNMLGAYQQNMQNSVLNALRAQVESPAFGTPAGTQPGQDIWRFLLGV